LPSRHICLDDDSKHFFDVFVFSTINIEVLAPFASQETPPNLGDFILPTMLSSSNHIPSPMMRPRVNLDLLRALDVSDERAIRWITTLGPFQ
jgi:hypothetical protein